MSPLDALLTDLAPSAFLLADFAVRTVLWLGAALGVLSMLGKRSAALRHLVGLASLLALPALPLAMAWSPPVLGLLPSFARGVARPADPWAAWPTVASSPSWLAPAVALWALGAIVLAGRTLAAGRDLDGFHVRGRTFAQADDLLERARAALGIRQRPALATSDEVDVPVTFGLFDAKILLPADARSWSADRLYLVLLHELAHLRRRDLVAQTASLAIAFLFWWHPLVWRMAARLDLERERAADDLVLRATGNAAGYARQLVEIAEALRGRPVAAFGLAMARPSQLGSRLASLLADDVDRRSLGGLQTALVAAATLALLGPLAALPERAADAPTAGATETAGTTETAIDVPRRGHGSGHGASAGHASAGHASAGRASAGRTSAGHASGDHRSPAGRPASGHGGGSDRP